MKNLLTLLSFSLLILTGCGGLKKEITRLKDENKSQTESYEKRISELTVKISETETREAKSKTDLEIKTSEISALKKERSQLQEQLDKKERSDFSVESPNGPVKITDSKGNQYEFQGGVGTKISNSSESTLSSKLNQVTESLTKQTERAENLTKTVSSQNNTIRQKNTQISERTEEIKKLSEKIKVLNEQLAKAVLRTGIPWYVWTLFGVFLLAAGQLLWKIYVPKKPLKEILK